ncbi:MoeA2: molybdopterin biosynthesis protein [Desulfosarcina variabilis str. Montpellier]|uniref:molybdopterin molybdotransferase MoeA n=1 Tax=Desulfosarcina variabilis TaxID=2300 RepID=UPI003AFB0027
MPKEQLGYKDALQATLDTIGPLTSEIVSLDACADRIVSEDLCSKVCSPSIDSSMKDGYAVKSEDIQSASPENKISLSVIDMAAAGIPAQKAVTGGTAIRIQTGAKIPDGATAVLAEEFATRTEDTLTVFNTAHAGRNIMRKGADVGEGERIARKGSRLSPGMIGLIAAAGFSQVPVYCQPSLAILATGDELVLPGNPLPAGKLYASNLEMLKAWCQRYGIATSFSILIDQPDIITKNIDAAIDTHDALITSGGAWSGDRDFVAETLNRLGWKKVFHWIRMGPGKPVGFGMLKGKPVFLLPGGPPSNFTAFIQIALPGLLKLSGDRRPALPAMPVKLSQALTCRHIDWTEFVYGTLHPTDAYTLFKPNKLTSRIKSIASAQGVIAIPEGVKSIPADAVVTAQLLI